MLKPIMPIYYIEKLNIKIHSNYCVVPPINSNMGLHVPHCAASIYSAFACYYCN